MTTRALSLGNCPGSGRLVRAASGSNRHVRRPDRRSCSSRTGASQAANHIDRDHRVRSDRSAACRWRRRRRRRSTPITASSARRQTRVATHRPPPASRWHRQRPRAAHCAARTCDWATIQSACRERSSASTARTGDALPDNPLAAAADPNARRIVAYGLRNPYRFTLRPGTDEIWIADVGWDTYEELDLLRATAGDEPPNYGWPCFEGPYPLRRLGRDGDQRLQRSLCPRVRRSPFPVMSFAHAPRPRKRGCNAAGLRVERHHLLRRRDVPGGVPRSTVHDRPATQLPVRDPAR